MKTFEVYGKQTVKGTFLTYVQNTLLGTIEACDTDSAYVLAYALYPTLNYLVLRV